MRKGMATEKQVRYALMLLGNAGYSTTWMDASFNRLGATMRERGGAVSEWLSSMSVYRCSALIEGLIEDAKENEAAE